MDAQRQERRRWRIGQLAVDPARGIVSGPAGETRVEPKVMDVLCLLAERQGEVVGREELIDAIWKVEYGGDESLTRAVSILRKALGDARAIETLPKRGYRLTAPVTPIPAKTRAENAGRPDAPPAQPGSARRRAWPVVVLAIAIAAVIAAAVYFRHGDEIATAFVPNGRVEVRAFEVIAEGPDARRFGAGLRDSMIRVLTVSGIKTRSRTLPIPGSEAASQSELILTGSIDRENERYLVTVHIEEQKNGLTLWSEQFERGVDETTALQNQVATRVAGILRCGLAARAPHIGEMTSETFSLFLQACAYFGGFYGDDELIALHALTRRIVEAAPNFGESHGFFAYSTAVMADLAHMSSEEVEAYLAAARESAARALELDPDTGVAYHALAVAAPGVPQRWAEKESYLRKVKPSDMSYSHALVGLVWLARGSGRLDEAIELQRRAAALDPFSPFHAGALAWLLANQNELRQADALIARAESLWPDANDIKDYRLQIATWRKPPDVAERLLSNAVALRETVTDDDILCTKAILEVRRRGKVEASSDIFRGADCFKGRRNEFAARLRSLAGDVDGAYRELERVNFDEFGNTIFLFFPEMDAVRRDPRFMQLAHRIGLVDYWLETDRWPDFCAEPDLPYDCKEAAQTF